MQTAAAAFAPGRSKVSVTARRSLRSRPVCRNGPAANSSARSAIARCELRIIRTVLETAEDRGRPPSRTPRDDFPDAQGGANGCVRVAERSPSRTLGRHRSRVVPAGHKPKRKVLRECHSDRKKQKAMNVDRFPADAAVKETVGAVRPMAQMLQV